MNQVESTVDGPPERCASRVRVPRASRLRLAVLTSIGNKFAAAAIQLTALPLAARALGAEPFGVYATLAASLSWISLAGVGVGPGLTLGIATTCARDDRLAETRYFSSALLVTIAMTLTLGGILAALYALLPVQALFGDRYVAYGAEIRPAIVILGVLLLLQLIANVPEAARAGYQETYITNVYGMIGNLCTIPSLLAVTLLYPSISGIILAVYGTPLVARLGNLAQLLARDRPYLRPRMGYLDRKAVEQLLGNGVAFTLVHASSLMLYQASVLIVGRRLGPGPVAGYAVLVQFLTLTFGLLGIIGQPLWPAIAEAAESGDLAWVRASLRNFLALTVAIALACGASLCLLGQTVIELLYGKGVAPDRSLVLFMSLYFLLSIWEHAIHTVLVGLRYVWWPALAVLGRSIAVVCVAPMLIDRLGVRGIAVALCSSMVVNLWLFPLMLRRAVAGARARHGHSAAPRTLHPPAGARRVG